MKGLVRLWRDKRGAVAPVVALSLLGLVASAGLAFDYARLAGLDTELQSAADQAALAAATQLDRYEGAQARATASITATGNANRLAANLTRFANDDQGSTVDVSLIFCSAFDDEVADTAAACTATNEDEDARFVVVTTEARVANYALTPIVAALSSGPITATAVAGVESSNCNVSPLLVCTADNNFPTDADIGKGMILKAGSGNSWAPGNYGLLDFGNGNNAVIAALLGHGLDGCQDNDDGSTEPGNKNVTDAINTRLDVYGGSPATSDPAICDATTGAGCPALSARKDAVAKLANFVIETTTNVIPTQATAEAAAPMCPADPKAASLTYGLPSQPVRGLDRDLCHYSGTCADGNFGDGVWNATGYFAQNHGGDASGALAFAGKANISDLTRYDVYKWELDDPASRMIDKRSVTIDPVGKKKGSRWEWTVSTQCNYPNVKYGRTDYPAQKDRRILPVVAANCDGLMGKGEPGVDYTLLRVFDVFITEPSMQRSSYPGTTDNKEIYGEVVGPAATFEGGSGFQYYSKSKPYLVR